MYDFKAVPPKSRTAFLFIIIDSPALFCYSVSGHKVQNLGELIMAFDWKKKLEEGKKLASAAFDTAVEKGAELGGKIGQKADELDAKYGPQIEAGMQKIEDKTTELAGKVTKKVDDMRGKKSDAPKQG
jgi:hypothetical protein